MPVPPIISSLGSEEEEQQVVPPEAEKPDSRVFGRVADLGIDAAKGVVGFGNSIVGLGDMITGGLIGKGLGALGYDAKETEQSLASLYSDARQFEEREIAGAQGVVGTIQSLVENPMALTGRVVETVPHMLSSMAAAKYFSAKAGLSAYETALASGADKTIALKMSELAAARAGTIAASVTEGLQQAGGSFEDLTSEGVELGKAYAAALGSGVTTTLFGYGGGRLGQKIGLGDVEAGVAGTLGSGKGVKGLAGRVLAGMAQEGLLEEFPQSATEQMWSNYATDKPITEGALKAGVTGMVVGGVAGGAFNIPSTPIAAPEKGPLATAADMTRNRLMPLDQDGAMRRAETLTLQGVPHGVVPHPEARGKYAVVPINQDLLTKQQNNGVTEVDSIRVASELGEHDRRFNALRQSIDQMTPEQQAAAIHDLREMATTSRLTGLKNKDAFAELYGEKFDKPERPPFLMKMDADGLKTVNDLIGHQNGDALLRTMGQAIREELDDLRTEGDFDIEAFHESGDEFAMAGSDSAAMVSVAKAAQERMKQATLIGVTKDGEQIEISDLGFSFGIASTFEEAEHALAADKETRTLSGERAARGEIHQGVRFLDRPVQRGEGAAAAAPTEGQVTDLDAAAHEAATSPANDLSEPTEAQKAAGNYKMGHLTVQGLDITIENPQGSTRSGTNKSGTPWSVQMANHYGYFKRTKGAEGDQVDTFIGPNPESEVAFVVNQVDPETGVFDEHKVMLGFPSQEAAEAAYRANYAPGWKGMGNSVAVPVGELKGWLNEGDTTKPYGDSAALTKFDQDRPEHWDITVEPFRNTDGSYRRNQRGDITGAPPGVKDESHIEAIVKKNVGRLDEMFKADPKRAKDAAEWYDNSGNAVRMLTRGDKALMESVVRIMARLSADNQVGGNVTAMVKAAHQLARGEEVVAGRYPNNTKGQIEAIVAAPEFNKSLKGVDDKVMNFYRNLHDAAFGEDTFDDATTMDMWMARLYDYPEVDRINYGEKAGKTNRFGKAQYRFANMLTQRITEEYNKARGVSYKPRHIQAALWTYARDQMKGKAAEVVDFSTYLSRATEHVTAEAIPSTRYPYFRSIHAAPFEIRAAYTKAAMAVLSDGNGNDVLLEKLRAPLYNTEDSAGTFEGAVNPNFITNIVAPKVPGTNGNLVYDRKVADLYAIIQMYLHSQDAVPWFRADPTLNKSLVPEGNVVSRGVAIRFQSKPDAKTLEGFYTHLREHVPGAEVTVVGDDVLAINFRDPSTDKPWGMGDKQFVAAIKEAAETFDVEGNNDIVAVLDDVKVEGAYHAIENYGTSWETPEEAVSKLESAISEAGRPDLLSWLRDRRAEIGRIQEDFENGRLTKYDVTEREANLFSELRETQQKAEKLAEKLKRGRHDYVAKMLKHNNWRPKNTHWKELSENEQRPLQRFYERGFRDIVAVDTNGTTTYRQAKLEERGVINSVLLDLMDAGLPAKALMNIVDIGVTVVPQDHGTSASFIPAQWYQGREFKDSIWINVNDISVLRETGDEVISSALRHTLSHEIGHNVDIGSNKDHQSHTWGSRLFRVNPFEIKLVSDGKSPLGGRVETGRGLGPIMKEVMDFYLTPASIRSGIQTMLNYPLVDLMRMNLVGKLFEAAPGVDIILGPETKNTHPEIHDFIMMKMSDEINRVTAEVFAQLHAMFYTVPAEMQKHLPKSYALMQEVQNAVIAAKNTNELDRKLRAVFRTPSTKLRPYWVQGELFDGKAGGGAKKRKAGRAVGKGAEAGAAPQHESAQDVFDARRPTDLQRLIRFNTQQVTSNPNFASWFAGSKVVDENGDPLEVYHGTTHDFDQFSTVYTNPENYFGVGFYFTDSISDVNNNYLGDGPDITSRIENTAERFDDDAIADYISERDNIDLDEAEFKMAELNTEERQKILRDIAKAELGIEHEGAIMPVFLKMTNPVEVTPKGGTVLVMEMDNDYYRDIAKDEVDEADYTDDGELNEERYNEALEERTTDIFYDDTFPKFTGNAAGIYDALRDASYEVGMDGALVVDKFREEYGYDVRLTANKLVEWLKSLPERQDAQDPESGAYAGDEMVRSVFERMGFDGIIMDADDAFGIGRVQRSFNGYGSAMRGVSNTKHYIAFHPEQIKSSIGNTGEYSPSPSILMSDKGKGFGRKAAEVQADVDQLTKTWKNGPALSVVSHRAMLPARLQQAALRVRGNPEGVFDADTNTVYLIADNLPTTADVQRVVLHEVFGHWAPTKAYGKEFEPLLDLVADSYGNKLRGIAARHGVDLATREGRLIAAQEQMAELAELGTNPTLLNKLVLMFKRLLHNLGFKVTLNDSDLKTILASAGRMVYEGDSAVTRAGLVPLFSHKSSAFYSEMKEHLAQKLPGKGQPGQLRIMINNMASKGQFKAEELKWSGLDNWLAEQKGPVTKEQILKYLEDNAVTIEEVMLGGDVPEDDFSLAEDTAGYGDNLSYIFEAADDYRYEAIYDQRRGEFVLHDEKGNPVMDEHGVITAPSIVMVRRFVRQENKARMLRTYITGESPAQYSSWTGGGTKKGYRELLLKLPLPPRVNVDKEMARWNELAKKWVENQSLPEERRLTKEELAEYKELENYINKVAGEERMSKTYRAPHFGDEDNLNLNILAHTRFDERTDADGKKVLFIEEVQSDWHQKGREEGYAIKKYKVVNTFGRAVLKMGGRELAVYDTREEAEARIKESGAAADGWVVNEVMSGVPDAPFKKTWPMLAMKRMIRYAAENGFDRIAWTTGEMQAKRYKLSKHIQSLNYRPLENGNYLLAGQLKDGTGMLEIGEYPESELSGVVGKAVAEKIINREGPVDDDVPHNYPYKIRGVDLDIGGGGMKSFYDNILPNELGKYIKQWGAKVGTVKIGMHGDRGAGVTGADLQRLGLTEHPFTISSTENEADGYTVTNRITGEEKVFNDYDFASIYITEQMGLLLYAEEVMAIDVTPEMRSDAMQGQPLFAASNQQATRTIKGWWYDKADRVIAGYNRRLGPMGNLPQQDRMLAMRQQAMGRIAKVNEVTKRISSILGNLLPEEMGAVYDYFTTRDANPETLPDRPINVVHERGAGRMFAQRKERGLRTEIMAIKRLIREVGVELVKRDLIPQESYENYVDRYLPRLYLAHLLDQDTFAAVVGGKKPSRLGYTMPRNDELDAMTRLIMGEIKDPTYLAAKSVGTTLRDIAILDFLSEISRVDEWVIGRMITEYNGRRVTPQWLINEGTRIIARSNAMSDEGLMSNREVAKAVGADMVAHGQRVLAEAGLTDAEMKDYRQVPDTPRYGSLRGLWVRNEIYNDLMGGIGAVQSDTVWESLLGSGGIGTKVTQLWKMSKVALNPPSQVRNFISNMVMVNIGGGIPLHKIPGLMLRAFGELRHNGEYWRLTKREGITESTFTANELFRLDRDFRELQKRQGTLGIMGQLALAGSAIADFAGDAYQLSEALGKTMLMMHNIEKKGMTPTQAAVEANRVLFDYSHVHPGVKYLRNAPIGAPFVTYYYKALPVVMEAMMKHPQRFLPYMMIPAMIAQAIASSFDVDDDDLDKLKMALPKWVRERGHALLLPYKDSEGRWQAFDYGYFLPWGMFSDVLRDVKEGEIGDAVKTTGIFGGPISELLVGIKTGKDSFTGRPIYYEADPAKQQFADIMNYLWRMAMPTWMTDIGAAAHTYRALTGHVDPRTGEPTANTSQAMLRWLGMNVYPIDPEHTRAMNLMQYRYEMQSIKARMSRRVKDQNLTNEERRKIAESYMEKLKETGEKMKEYAEASRVHPNLRVTK
jgi:diguanylate cyclase (GGDEF)-like protein